MYRKIPSTFPEKTANVTRLAERASGTFEEERARSYLSLGHARPPAKVLKPPFFGLQNQFSVIGD